MEVHQPAMVHQRFNVHFPVVSWQKSSLVALQQLKILAVDFTDVSFCPFYVFIHCSHSPSLAMIISHFLSCSEFPLWLSCAGLWPLQRFIGSKQQLTTFSLFFFSPMKARTTAYDIMQLLHILHGNHDSDPCIICKLLADQIMTFLLQGLTNRRVWASS